MLLWSDQNSDNTKELDNGDILTITGESQINNSYLFTDQNIIHTIATSKVAFFRHLPNAKKYREQFVQYQDWYAVNMNPQGLVIRSAAESKADQVYRLRPRQTVKILDQVTNTITLGNIEGKWYEVLTEDGIRGFTFDYYLRIEDRAVNAEKKIIKLAAFEKDKQELDIKLSSLQGIWYQKKYTEALRSGKNIDTRLLMLPQGEGKGEGGQLYLDRTQGKVLLYLDKLNQPSQIIDYAPGSVEIDSSAELKFHDSYKTRITFHTMEELSIYYHTIEGDEFIFEFQKISKEELLRYQKHSLARRKILLSAIFRDGSQLAPLSYTEQLPFSLMDDFLGLIQKV